MPDDHAPATVAPDAIRAYDEDAPHPDATETATFGLGCFWGPDSRFGAMAGVVRTRVGYAGGSKPDPTYHALGDHTEVVQVDYDPGRLSFAALLAVAFDAHSPHHQARKRQYHHVVFHDGDDHRRALARFLDDRGLDADGIATRVEPLEQFHLAEDYHQKYDLRADPWLSGRFEDAGYGAADLCESPAAAKLNGHAAGHDVPEDDRLARAVSRRP